jgi:hypothetical protein
MTDMDGRDILQLVTLWFVVLTFVRTGSGGDGPVMAAVGLVAVLFTLVLPITILLSVALWLTE